MMKYVLSTIGIASLSFASASADDKNEDELRKLIECHPAKDIIKFMNKLDGIKPERRDTIDSIVSAKFEVKDGGALPDRLFLRENDAETNLIIRPDGTVPDFASMKTFSDKTELCGEDSARAGQPKSKDDISFEVDMDVMFKNQSGSHTMTELEDGVGDGKSHYKKMVPGAFSMLVPKMTHVTVSYDDESTPPQIMAMKDGAAIDGLIIEPFSGSHVIEFEHLENIGTEILVIAGGPYKLEPTPSIKKMKSFGGDEADN